MEPPVQPCLAIHCYCTGVFINCFYRTCHSRTANIIPPQFFNTRQFEQTCSYSTGVKIPSEVIVHVDHIANFLASYIQKWLSFHSATVVLAQHMDTSFGQQIEVTAIESWSVDCQLFSITAPNVIVTRSSVKQFARILQSSHGCTRLLVKASDRYHINKSVFSQIPKQIIGMDTYFSILATVPLQHLLLAKIQEAVQVISIALLLCRL